LLVSVTVENLLTLLLFTHSLYRWHAAISRQDEEWIDAEMKKWGPRGKAPVDYTEQDFFDVYYKMTKAMGESRVSLIPSHERRA
jgi:hypothetical protein